MKQIKDSLEKNINLSKHYHQLVNQCKQNILWYLPKGIAHKLFYYRRMGEKLDLKNPSDFNEKIQWLIVNRYGEKESQYADKYLVRKYVKEKGYSDILPKLYNVYDNPKEIDIDLLPEKFVLKANHGSGPEYYSICYNKETYDLQREIERLDRSLKYNYAKKRLEYHYSYIKPRIICEEYIDDSTGTRPIDYKVFCFGGQPECILVCSDRDNDLKRDYYDAEWNYLKYTKQKYRSRYRHERPKNLEKMLMIAKDLSQPFSFVRVDFYNVGGKIYFGELTLTPAAGMNKTYTREALDYLGSLVDLNYNYLIR